MIKRFFNAFDTDHDGFVRREEFCEGISVCCKGSLEEKIDFMFRLQDLDGDGDISKVGDDAIPFPPVRHSHGLSMSSTPRGDDGSGVAASASIARRTFLTPPSSSRAPHRRSTPE